MGNKNKMRRAAPVALGLLVTALALAVKGGFLASLSYVDQRLEWVVFDQRMRATLPDEVEPDPRIAIVNLDERSLAAEGRWPWSRRKVARLVEQVFAAGGGLLVMDVVFAEQQRNAADQVLNHWGGDLDPQTRSALKSLIPRSDPDRALAEAVEKYPVVLGYAFTGGDAAPIGQLPAPLMQSGEGVPPNTPIAEMRSYVSNLPRLQRAAGSAGFFSVVPDDDGVIRRVPLLLNYQDKIYPSLALEAVRQFLGIPDVSVSTAPVGDYEAVEQVSLGGGMLSFPVDAAGNVVVPFQGPAGSFRYISATDVLHGRVDPDALNGAIVLLGTTASGLYDLRSTPVEKVFPGVEIQANVIAGLLDGSFPRRPSWGLGADVAVIALLGLLATFLFPRLSPAWLLAFSGLFIAAAALLNFWAWGNGMILSAAAPVVTVFLIATLNMAYGFLVESRGRRRLKSIFGQYVPPERVEEMSQNPEDGHALEGESREMTVLFADIRSFTSISESLASSELKQLLNYFFTPMTRIIFDHRGTIDKYVGDMIMSFWGAPVADPQHRRNAIAAGLEMLVAVDDLKVQFAKRGWPEIDIGIGLNTGVMNVGDMGSEFRRAYTVIGDAVNLGSRLEGLTKFYGVRFVVSESTREGQDEFVFRRLDLVRVKGKSEAVAIYEPVCRTEHAGPHLLAELDAYQKALSAYYEQDWDRAEAEFAALADNDPGSTLYGLYLQRVSELRGRRLGPDWDGVYQHTSK